MQVSAASWQAGMQYLLQAAESRHRAAMIEMARALDSGRTEEHDEGTLSNSRYVNFRISPWSDSAYVIQNVACHVKSEGEKNMLKGREIEAVVYTIS